jgi:hypothetical protein
MSIYMSQAQSLGKKWGFRKHFCVGFRSETEIGSRDWHHVVDSRGRVVPNANRQVTDIDRQNAQCANAQTVHKSRN